MWQGEVITLPPTLPGVWTKLPKAIKRDVRSQKKERRNEAAGSQSWTLGKVWRGLTGIYTKFSTRGTFTSLRSRDSLNVVARNQFRWNATMGRFVRKRERSR